MALFITEAAEQDVANQVDYLAERNADAARRYAWAVRETFEFVERIPGAGSLREYNNPRLIGLRSRVVRGFEKYLVSFFARLREASRLSEPCTLRATFNQFWKPKNSLTDISRSLSSGKQTVPSTSVARLLSA